MGACKNADHYKIDVFYVPKYDFNNIEKIASCTCPQGMDYYDNKAYTKKDFIFSMYRHMTKITIN